MKTPRTHSSKRLAVLGMVALAASALGGCTGTYLYSDYGWSNSYGGHGGDDHYGSRASIGYGSSYYGGSYYSGSHYGSSHRYSSSHRGRERGHGGDSHRGGSRSHSSGHSGRH